MSEREKMAGWPGPATPEPSPQVFTAPAAETPPASEPMDIYAYWRTAWQNQIQDVVGEETAGKIIKLAELNGMFDPFKGVPTAASANADSECQQIAGRALGYPWYVDDPTNFPGATEVDGVCVGEHVGATIVQELSDAYLKLKAASANARPQAGVSEEEIERVIQTACLDLEVDANGEITGIESASHIAARYITRLTAAPEPKYKSIPLEPNSKKVATSASRAAPAVVSEEEIARILAPFSYLAFEDRRCLSDGSRMFPTFTPNDHARKAARAILSRLTATPAGLIGTARQYGAWQPISTPPSAGAPVDIWVPGIGRIADCKWALGRKCWIKSIPNGVQEIHLKPSHWMSVPAVPEREGRS